MEELEVVLYSLLRQKFFGMPEITRARLSEEDWWRVLPAEAPGSDLTTFGNAIEDDMKLRVIPRRLN
jgi:hypothetical protein